MRFNELYYLIYEEYVLEENFLQKLKCVLMAGALGMSSCDYDSQEKIQDIARENPQKYQNLADEIGRKVVFLSTQEPEKIQEIKNVINQDNSVEKIKQIVQKPKTVLTIASREDSTLQIDKNKQIEFYKKAKDYIEKNENHDLKIRNKWYKDNKGYPTIGIGHLIIKDDATNGVLKKGEFSVDKKGNIISAYISDSRAREIFDIDLLKKLKKIKEQFPRYDFYPESVKIVLLDGFFRGDLAGSPSAKALIKTAMDFYFKKDFKKAQVYLNSAANEYTDSKEYRTSKKQKSGIYKRMNNNANILRNSFKQESLDALLTQNVYL
jgi:hypothetical protein